MCVNQDVHMQIYIYVYVYIYMDAGVHMCAHVYIHVCLCQFCQKQFGPPAGKEVKTEFEEKIKLMFR